MTDSTTTPRKRLLFLAADFPLPVASGSQIRQMNLIKSLSKRFDVTLITLSMQDADQQYIAELQRYATQVIAVRPANKRSLLHRIYFKVIFAFRRLFLGDSNDRFYRCMPNITRTIVETMRAQPFDVLFAIHWFWDARIWETTARIVIDTNDVQWHRVERLLERSTNPFEKLMKGFLLRRYQEMEIAGLRQADLIVAITERDRQEFERMLPAAPQVVIPTGLDTDWFVPQGEPQPDHIAFFGAMRNPMNQDAIEYLLTEVWPLLRQRMPQLRLSLIGAGAPAAVQELVAAAENVTMTGYVEDIRQPIRSAVAILLPLRIGWGIRGRVFEVMSMGVPVVATPVAIDGMELVEGDGILLANSPEEFAETVRSLVDDPQRRDRIGQKGREVALRTASIAATYDRLSEDLCSRW